MNKYTAKVIYTNEPRNDRDGNVCYMDIIAIYIDGAVNEYIEVLSVSGAVVRDDAVVKAIGSRNFEWIEND